MDCASIQHSTLNIEHLPFASSSNPLSYRISKVPSILPHLVAANIRRVNDAGQRLAGVRRDLVAMLDIVCVHDELCVRIEGDDVRVVSGRQLPFAMTESGQRG